MLIFDTTAHGNGDLFGGPMRYLDAMRDGYGLPADEVLAVMALHGSAWAAVLDDERWARYDVGRVAGVIDAVSRTPAPRNSMRSHTDPAKPTLESVQARGTVVVVCNNTLRRVSRELAAAQPDRNVDTVYADLRAGILPGVTVVPAVLGALQLAQTRGCGYAMGTS
jgi:intracellular sulfur oxidation DsrE/DsrF family protein